MNYRAFLPLVLAIAIAASSVPATVDAAEPSVVHDSKPVADISDGRDSKRAAITAVTAGLAVVSGVIVVLGGVLLYQSSTACDPPVEDCWTEEFLLGMAGTGVTAIGLVGLVPSVAGLGILLATEPAERVGEASLEEERGTDEMAASLFYRLEF